MPESSGKRAVWVPGVRAPEFVAEAHRQSAAIAASKHEAVDAAAIDTDRRRALREALVDGENSGKSTEFNVDIFLSRMRIMKLRHHDD